MNRERFIFSLHHKMTIIWRRSYTCNNLVISFRMVIMVIAFSLYLRSYLPLYIIQVAIKNLLLEVINRNENQIIFKRNNFFVTRCISDKNRWLRFAFCVTHLWSQRIISWQQYWISETGYWSSMDSNFSGLWKTYKN